MRTWVLISFLLLNGCSHTAATATSASASAQTNNGAPLAALLLMAVFISAATEGTLLEPQPAAPPMDPNRTVVEQDCTKPIDISRGNLRCK